jgi:hypothetical protein
MKLIKHTLLGFSIGATISLLLIACYTSPENRIRKDLIGHTMGGREQAWYFSDKEQIKQLKIEQASNSLIWVSMVLHDNRVKPSYYAKALLTYEDGHLQMVSLLSMEQIQEKK